METQDFNNMMGHFMDLFGNVLSDYEKKNPDWFTTRALFLVYGAVTSLQHYIESPDEKEISWEQPFIELTYPVQMNWDNLQPLFFILNQDELQNLESIPDTATNAFFETLNIMTLQRLTKYIAVIIENGKEQMVIPDIIGDNLHKLPSKTRNKMYRQLNQPTEMEIPFNLEYETDGGKGKRRFKCSILLQFNPLTIDCDNRTAHYSVYVGLGFKGIRITKQSSEFHRVFFDGLLEKLMALVPEEDFNLLKKEKPLVSKTKAAPKDFIPTPRRIEEQKVGPVPQPGQLMLFPTEEVESTDTLKILKELKIEVRGIELSHAQDKAHHAICRLLADGKYQQKKIKVTLSTWYDAYGVTKRATARGKTEYNVNECNESIKALEDLLTKQHLIIYEKHYWEKDKKGKDQEKTDRVEEIMPLVINIKKLWKGLSRPENQALDDMKPTAATQRKFIGLLIEPCHIYFDQIGTYFVMTPTNIKEILRLLAPHGTVYIGRFLNLLFLEVAIRESKSKGNGNQDWIIRWNWKTLAYKLRMNKDIEQQRWKKIKSDLKKCYEVAKEAGLLLSYSTEEGKSVDTLEVLALNPSGFYHRRKVLDEKMIDIQTPEKCNSEAVF